MTDLERFVELYKSFDIAVVVDTAGAPGGK